jgi:uncharacterized membrane protein YgcG
MSRKFHSVRNVGLALAAAGVGVVAAEGAAAGDGVAGHLTEGKVTAVGANSFTITNAKGTETIDTTTATAFHELGSPVNPTGVADGQDVVVALSQDDTTPTAVSVTILLNRVSGKVTSVSGSTITLAAPGGSREVIVSPSTAYYSGKTTVSGVTDGEWVTAFGTRDSSTTPPELDALFVDVFTPPTTPPRPHHGPRFGLFHGWAFGLWDRSGTLPGSVRSDAVRQDDQTMPAPANAPAPSTQPPGPRPDQAPAPHSGWSGGGWSGGTGGDGGHSDGGHSDGGSQSGGGWSGGGWSGGRS